MSVRSRPEEFWARGRELRSASPLPGNPVDGRGRSAIDDQSPTVLRDWNEDLLCCPADDLRRSGIESATDETADERHDFDKIYHTPGACLRNEPETDGPIDPLQNFPGDPKD